MKTTDTNASDPTSSRAERRTGVSIVAEYRDPGGGWEPVMIVDISASGARIHTDHVPGGGVYDLHFGVYGKTYDTRFEVARIVEAGDDRYWGVHFLDLSATDIIDLRRSVNVIAGEAKYELLEWEDIRKEAESGMENVLVGFSATGEDIVLAADFVLRVGPEGLHTYLDAHDSGKSI